ncbi:hypothetical protein BGZ79_009454 [Entomortierella chlamydospora]|nr:hypothetical protein BGZ79_009454 [Entomortierella chlamydospora]
MSVVLDRVVESHRRADEALSRVEVTYGNPEITVDQQSRLLVYRESLGLFIWTFFVMAVINPEWYSNQIICMILSMALIVSLYDFVQFKWFYRHPENNKDHYHEWYLALVRMDKLFCGIGLVGVEHLILNLLGWTGPTIVTSAFSTIICLSSMVTPELIWFLKMSSPDASRARNERRRF